MFGLKATPVEQEHTDSYYAATANNHTQYPPLTGDVSVDIAVVGGGFSGVNTALELAEKGYTVALIEAKRIGWGATGRNGGQIIGGIGHSHERFKKAIGDEGIRALYDMGNECCEIIRERVAKYNIDCDLTWGYADVALKPRHMREFEATAEYHQKMGYPYDLTLVDKAELNQRVVGSERYIGGLINQQGYGHVHPLNLCLGEARALASLGGLIYEQSPVTRVIEGDQPEVHTEHGRVKAKHVVLCGNAYMGELKPSLSNKVLPSNSCVITTEPLGDLADTLMPGNFACCDPRTALDYFRLTADGRLLFGGLSNYTGLEPSNIETTLRKNMLEVFPQLADKRIDYSWSGQMGIGINRLPQLGRLNGNVYYIQAFSGHGVAPTHLTARVTAELIDGQASRHDIFAKVNHMTWPGGRMLRRPAMAVGMLWFKMLDLL